MCWCNVCALEVCSAHAEQEHASLPLGCSDMRWSVLQGNGPYLPPRSGAIRKPSITSPSLQTVPRRPRTRPDYSKIITASCCEQGCSCGPDPLRSRAQAAERPRVHHRETPLRA